MPGTNVSNSITSQLTPGTILDLVKNRLFKDTRSPEEALSVFSSHVIITEALSLYQKSCAFLGEHSILLYAFVSFCQSIDLLIWRSSLLWIQSFNGSV